MRGAFPPGLMIGAAVVAAAVGAAVGVAQTPAPRPEPARFDVERVADGVYALIRTEPHGLLLDANSVFIVNDASVVVVDTNVTPASARASLAALRQITSKPVQYVINTHWHDDHVLGNQVYRDAFPDAKFIAHPSAVADLSSVGATTRRQLIEMAPRMAEQFRLSIDQEKSLGGGRLTDEERASYLSDAEAADRFSREAPGFEVIMPTVTVPERMTMTGARTIDIIHLGRGHSNGDLVVYLPAERVVITGDLVVHPVPIVGASSHPLEFVATLERLLALGATRFVPGHGPVLRDDTYIRRVRDHLAAMSQQVLASVARGDSLDDTRRAVDLEPFRRQVAGDSQHRRFLFDTHVATPGVAAAWRDARSRR